MNLLPDDDILAHFHVFFRTDIASKAEEKSAQPEGVDEEVWDEGSAATKAGVINLAESLRAERPDVDVRLICPGFVDTRMTRRNRFRMPAIMPADKAAAAIMKGLAGKQFEIHFPHRLTRTLKLIRALPYAASLRLTRRLSRDGD